jgi:hypothetical protein
MSSEQAIRGILQSHLLTLGWETQTAFEGKAFTPNASTPYQEVSTVFAEPLPRTLAGSDEHRGTFQVRLLYPLSTPGGTGVTQVGIGAATARAEAIKAAFPRNLKLSSGGQTVKVLRTAHITRGPVQGDRDVTIIRVRFGDR